MPMDARPLAGRTYRSSTTSPAAELVCFVLRDLGARVEPAAAGARADLADQDQGEAGVNLSPYGPRGRFRDAPAHHAAVEAVGGALMGQYTYEPGPAYLVNPFSTVGQALLATAAVIGNGLGASASDVSGLQGLFAMQAGVYAYGEVADKVRWATTPRGQLPTYATYRGSDDWFFIGASTHPFFIKVLQVVGMDDILFDPRAFEGPRAIRGTELEAALWEGMAERIRQRPRDAWLKDFEAVGVPAGPALSLEE